MHNVTTIHGSRNDIIFVRYVTTIVYTCVRLLTIDRTAETRRKSEVTI